LKCQEVNVAAEGKEKTSSTSFQRAICHSQQRQVLAQAYGAGSQKTWDTKLKAQAEITKGLQKYFYRNVEVPISRDFPQEQLRLVLPEQ